MRQVLSTLRTLLFGVNLYLGITYPALLQAQTHQHTEWCGHVNLEAAERATDPSYDARLAQQEQTLQQWIAAYQASGQKTNAVVTIPVVVHVVYNNATQNISDAQVQSAIEALNRDFRRTNTDANQTPAAFQGVAADVEIEFCLARQDPNGNPTNGITRTFTTRTVFNGISDDGNLKNTANGGRSPWNTSNYLNIWVCNLGSNLLGYATFPNMTSFIQGVVVNYWAFGTTGFISSPNDKNRTLTHEMGHYLNLRHIWGDATCGDDFVNDTPTQRDKNFSCPNFPKTSNCTGNGLNGDMFMNYMDYTNDACMNLFTQGQKTRMLAALNTSRASLLTSVGCVAPTASCSGTQTLTTSTGTVTDGSGAGNYSSNLNCSWLIQPLGVANVTLTFTQFGTEAGNDLVRVYDGANAAAPLLGTFSGSTLPAAITSTGPSLFITFTTNGSVSGAGWSANWVSSASSFCSNTTLTGTSGTFEDGSGAANYLNNTNCRWLIAPPNARRIVIRFTQFNTEANFDFVRIYNGNNTSAPLVATRSGSSLGSAITVNGPQALVVFTTDNTNTAAGWTATYSAVTCGNDTLRALSDTITDGSLTGTYGDNSNCSWLIAPPGANTLNLRFLSYDTELGYDSIYVYDGPNTTWPILAALSGVQATPGAVFTSTSGRVFVRFISDVSVTGDGFELAYTTNLANQCSTQTLTAASGSLGDGSGANNYQNSLECGWRISPPGATAITLTFTAFNTEQGYDFVRIYNGPDSLSPLLATYSGSTLPAQVSSTGGSMFVRFTSDFIETRAGWTANYTSVGATAPLCSTGTTLTAASGTVEDGSGPNNYLTNSNCSWLIQPAGAQRVQLTFTQFATESNRDFVRIYDGSDATAPLLGSYSGNSLPAALLSSTGSVFVTFTSDGQTNGQGFSLNYEGQSPTCTGTTTLTATTGTFTDGSAPTANYASNSNCRWLISVPGASTIRLTFNRFRLGAGDFVEVYDGNNTGATNLAVLSGTNLPAAILGSTNTMLVVFTSNATGNETGFEASYVANIVAPFCSGTTTLTTPSGTLTDGSGSANYVNGTNCSWLIQPPGATRITLNLSSIALGTGDFLQVFDGPNGNALELGNYSGTPGPQNLISTGGSMFVRFTTDAAGVAQGFSGTWTSQVTALDPSAALQNVRVYPNPTSGMVYLTGELGTSKDVTVTVYNLLGGTVQTQRLENQTRLDAAVNLTQLPAGVYLLQVTDGTHKVQHRIIRQ